MQINAHDFYDLDLQNAVMTLTTHLSNISLI